MSKKFDLAGLMAGQAARENVSDSDIRRLPVAELHENGLNFYSVEDVRELCDSIAVSGVLQPVLVRPRAEGGYLLIAGHRRVKAVRLLREAWKGEGENPWDTVPALVRPAPTNRAEELLEELALITTNAAARKLSDAELSKQAEKMTDILYGLKSEGYEFPGRMRKVVAEAVGVSETKIARLKKIREGLSVGWRERWAAGNVPEYTAEALAKLEPDVQQALLFKKKLDPYAVGELGRYYNKCHRSRKCALEEGRNCDWGEHFWAVGSRIERSYQHCGEYSSEMCCAHCQKAEKCGQCCPRALERVKHRAAEAAAQRKAREEKERREAEAQQKKADILWRRFRELREKAGVSLEEVKRALRAVDAYFTRDLAPYEDRDMEKLGSYFADMDPEQILSFKGCWAAARLFGVPVEALTEVKWKPEEGEAAAALDRSDTGDSPSVDATGSDTGDSPSVPGETEGTVPVSSAPVSSELWWRPFPKMKPEEGQRAFVLQGQGSFERLCVEAKLARWEGGAWLWVSELIPDVEAERVEWWLPEPRFPEAEEEEDDCAV